VCGCFVSFNFFVKENSMKMLLLPRFNFYYDSCKSYFDNWYYLNTVFDLEPCFTNNCNSNWFLTVFSVYMFDFIWNLASQVTVTVTNF
jgi:hypothetical protein